MKILVVGSGGREHALAWKFLQSDMIHKVSLFPGNAGALNDLQQFEKFHIIDHLEIQNQLWSPNSIKFIKSAFDWVVIGPETYLEAGMSDQLTHNGIQVIGPNKEAAQLESSKVFAKKFMQKFNIPTARYAVFTDKESAYEFVNNHFNQNKTCGLVVKMDQLAAGKGVIVCSTLSDCIQALNFFFLGGAGFIYGTSQLIIEQMVPGREVSVFALTNGKQISYLGLAQDFKRLKDNNQGPNTGGMGTATPLSWLSEQQLSLINNLIFEKTLQGLQELKMNYQGVIFAGLMIHNQEIHLLEYNVRLGDPETQSLVLKYPQADWAMLYNSIFNLEMNPGMDILDLNNKDQFVLHKVFASEGYPGLDQPIYDNKNLNYLFSNYRKWEIEFDCKFFFAGIKKQSQDWLSQGGRIFGVSFRGKTQEQVNQHVLKITELCLFEGVQSRNDISWG